MYSFANVRILITADQSGCPMQSDVLRGYDVLHKRSGAGIQYASLYRDSTGHEGRYYHGHRQRWPGSDIRSQIIKRV